MDWIRDWRWWWEAVCLCKMAGHKGGWLMNRIGFFIKEPPGNTSHFHPCEDTTMTTGSLLWTTKQALTTLWCFDLELPGFQSYENPCWLVEPGLWYFCYSILNGLMNSCSKKDTRALKTGKMAPSVSSNPVTHTGRRDLTPASCHLTVIHYRMRACGHTK